MCTPHTPPATVLYWYVYNSSPCCCLPTKHFFSIIFLWSQCHAVLPMGQEPLGWKYIDGDLAFKCRREGTRTSVSSYSGVHGPEGMWEICVKKEFSPLDFGQLGFKIIAMIWKVMLLKGGEKDFKGLNSVPISTVKCKPLHYHLNPVFNF